MKRTDRLGLSELITEPLLLKEAGDRAYERGLGYFHAGAVTDLVVTDDTFNARVEGGDEAESAAGVKGVLIRALDGAMMFRVYHDRDRFTDYEIRHDDLSVTIDNDELATFYKVGEEKILDHSPEVLGLKQIEV